MLSTGNLGEKVALATFDSERHVQHPYYQIKILKNIRGYASGRKLLFNGLVVSNPL